MSATGGTRVGSGAADRVGSAGANGVDGTAGHIYGAPVDLHGATMIDADKLIAAMEAAQNKKKKIRAKQMADAAEKDAREAAAEKAAAEAKMMKKK